jgi:CxxC motif-containing protein (DUF1111 family)
MALVPGALAVLAALAGCSGDVAGPPDEAMNPAAGANGGTAGTGAGTSSPQGGSSGTGQPGGVGGNVGGAGGGDVISNGGAGGSNDACAPPQVTPLYAGGDVPPIVERRADGVIVTRGAGRVRGRHELEGTYSEFGALYFENRTYAFTIEDHIAAGGDTIKFIYEPEAPVSENGAQTNFRFWKIYDDGNVFHTNVTMAKITPTHLEWVADHNAREGRAIQAGDLLEFEFGIFIAGNGDGDPGAIEGRTAYYTDTFRYRVGVGGLTAQSADSSGDLGPTADAQLAGDTTIPWIYAEPELYFSQMVLNMQPEHVRAWIRGRRLFHTDFGSGEHSEPGNPAFEAHASKLGPMFSATRCSTCHERDGRGGMPELGQPLRSMVVKLDPSSALGNQLQEQEGIARLDSFETREVMLADGTAITLQKPVFAFEGVDASELAPSIRVARQIPGMGLLEAIADADILARADADDCDGNGISGRASVVSDPLDPSVQRLGRIGWKAEKVSVAHQVADALDSDMGVTTPVLPGAGGEIELQDTDFEDLVTYSQLLALPARRNVDDPQVVQGSLLFAGIGCVNCHAPDATTGDDHPLVELRGQTIHPHSDLLLHDMGDDLADGSGTAQASEWRTAPLWGIGLVSTVSGHAHLLHDGRARDPIEAVLWHGGEAAFASEAVKALTSEERGALLAFLQSL